MQTAAEKTPHFYVSQTTERTVRLSVWPEGSSLHVSMALEPAAAISLAKQLMDAVNKLPRVAEASDLGIAA